MAHKRDAIPRTYPGGNTGMEARSLTFNHGRSAITHFVTSANGNRSTDAIDTTEAVLMSTWPAAHSAFTGRIAATGSATLAVGWARSIGER